MTESASTPPPIPGAPHKPDRRVLVPALGCLSLLILAAIAIVTLIKQLDRESDARVAAAPGSWWLSPYVSANCPALFPYEPTPVGNDSLLPRQHYPTEVASALAPAPYASATPAARACVGQLPTLAVETVVEDAGQIAVNFQISPDGRRIALDVWPDDLTILDMDTGQRWTRPNSKGDYLLFWGDDSSVFVSKDKAQGTYRWDFFSGQMTDYETRTEYDNPEAWRFTARVYNGWQAAVLLELPKDRLCRAVIEGRLHPLAASDGSLLLTGAELLKEGGSLLRTEYPHLLSSADIARLRDSAQDVRFTYSDWFGDAPISHVVGGHALILTGRNSPPQNVVVRVADETLWVGRPEIPAQIPINSYGRVGWPAYHADFFVDENPCLGPSDPGYRYVLYRKTGSDQDGQPVGIIPFPSGDHSSMAWSPDGRYIYIGQAALGRFSVSRLQLPEL